MPTSSHTLSFLLWQEANAQFNLSTHSTPTTSSSLCSHHNWSYVHPILDKHIWTTKTSSCSAKLLYALLMMSLNSNKYFPDANLWGSNGNVHQGDVDQVPQEDLVRMFVIVDGGMYNRKSGPQSHKLKAEHGKCTSNILLPDRTVYEKWRTPRLSGRNALCWDKTWFGSPMVMPCLWTGSSAWWGWSHLLSLQTPWNFLVAIFRKNIRPLIILLSKTAILPHSNLNVSLSYAMVI